MKLLIVLMMLCLGGCLPNIQYIDFTNPVDITDLMERKIDEIRVRHGEHYQPLMFEYKGEIVDPWWDYVEGYSTPTYIRITRSIQIIGRGKKGGVSKVMFHCTTYYNKEAE